MIPIIGFVIFTIVMSTVAAHKRKAVAEQMNRQPENTVRQAVQKTAPSGSAAPFKTPQSQIKNIPRAPSPAKKQEEAKEVHQVNDAVSVLKKQQPILAFSGEEAVKGILYAEILGKPKALR